jgi:hypothetical protein
LLYTKRGEPHERIPIEERERGREKRGRGREEMGRGRGGERREGEEG